MLQTWILRTDMPPLEAVRNDLDSSICGSCVHKGTHVDGKRVGRSCYVNVGQAPTNIWASYAAGMYRHVSLEEASELVAGEAVRLGAYGDPGMVPWEVLYQLVREHLETFLEEGRQRSAHGDGYPRYVEQTFRSYLQCGIMAHG